MITTPDLNTITPRFSADPLRDRGDNEPWLNWATELYAHTMAELAMTPEAWAVHFGMAHPGDGYTKALRAQQGRLGKEIITAIIAAERVPAKIRPMQSVGYRYTILAIFMGALEGESTYWAEIYRGHYHWSRSGAGVLHATDLDNFQAVITHDDIADPDMRHRSMINSETIVTGLEWLAARTDDDYPSFYATARAILNRDDNDPRHGDFDEGFADAVVQAGLFGAIVFG